MWPIATDVVRSVCLLDITVIYVKCCADWVVCLSVFLFIAFV